MGAQTVSPCNFVICRGTLQSLEMETQQVVSKPCAAEVSKAAALPGVDAAAAEGQTAVGSGEGIACRLLRRHYTVIWSHWKQTQIERVQLLTVCQNLPAQRLAALSRW